MTVVILVQADPEVIHRKVTSLQWLALTRKTAVTSTSKFSSGTLNPEKGTDQSLCYQSQRRIQITSESAKLQDLVN